MGIYVLIYMDDILILSPHIDQIKILIQSLSFVFSIKDLKKAHHFLGVEFIPHKDGYAFSQSAYIPTLL